VWETWRHHNMCWKWPAFASRQDWTRHAIFFKVLAITSAKIKHSLLQSIPIHFPTILCELTYYTNIHEQQPYCVGTLSQMTERSAERSVRQETGWQAGGPLLCVPKISYTLQTHTTDTTDTHYRHTLQSHTTDTHYRHTLQTHTTDAHYRHTLQTHATDARFRRTLQSHTTVTHYRHTLQTHYRHTLQTHTTVTHCRHALQTHTTDTFLFISHTTNVLLFKFRCNIVIGVRIIKEMPGSIASGTPCILVATSSWFPLQINNFV